MPHQNAQTQKLLASRVQPWAEKLPWHSTHPVRFDDSEGYEGNGVIGARAGPMDAIDFENLAHEMAHAIEILECGRPSALKRSGWGLRIKTELHIGHQTFYEPITMQASEREAMVCGIQLRIMELVGHPATKGFAHRHATTLTKWMPDYIFGGSSEDERIATRERLINDGYNKWPVARVAAAWRAAQPRLEAIVNPQPASDEPIAVMPRRRMTR